MFVVFFLVDDILEFVFSCSYVKWSRVAAALCVDSERTTESETWEPQ